MPAECGRLPPVMVHDSRRTFFSRFTAGLTAFGSAVAAAPAAAAPAPFQSARHSEDDWLDAIPGKHRFFLDATSPRGAGQAIVYTTNFLTASKNGYNLEDAESAIVICLRHEATPFAFTDAMWAKFGGPIGARLSFNDPRTNKAPLLNVYGTAGYGDALPNRNITLGALAGRGVHFAVCGVATRLFATAAANANGSTPDAVYKELTANLITNAHLAAAGVVAVNRAQERGYSFLYVG